MENGLKIVCLSVLPDEFNLGLLIHVSLNLDVETPDNNMNCGKPLKKRDMYVLPNPVNHLVVIFFASATVSLSFPSF